MAGPNGSPNVFGYDAVAAVRQGEERVPQLLVSLPGHRLVAEPDRQHVAVAVRVGGVVAVDPGVHGVDGKGDVLENYCGAALPHRTHRRE